jgi:hypothetical protein
MVLLFGVRQSIINNLIINEAGIRAIFFRLFFIMGQIAARKTGQSQHCRQRNRFISSFQLLRTRPAQLSILGI